MSEKSTYRIPSLDGLRAISIIFVVMGHAFKDYFKWMDIANLGVRVFFVISAFLIIGILMKNVEEKRFSLKTFYFKRIFRTFPAFYFYLLVVALFLLVIDQFEWDQFWRATVYLENYHPRSHWNSKQWFVGHSWSLAVEEQFYIVISILFIFFNRKLISQNAMVQILIAILIIIPLIRISYLIFDWIPDVLSGSIHRSFETVADSLAIGGLMVLLPKQKILGNKIVQFFQKRIALLVVFIFFCQMLNSSKMVQLVGLKARYLYNLIGLTVLNICLGLLIFIVIHYQGKSLFYRLLNSKLFINIGLWSYSIYLWQQVWLYPWDIPIGYKFLGIILTSLFSYYLIEKKFLNLRDQIVKKWN